jgi:hypothetical protein
MEVIARNIQFTPSHRTKKWSMKSHVGGFDGWFLTNTCYAKYFWFLTKILFPFYLQERNS